MMTTHLNVTTHLNLTCHLKQASCLDWTCQRIQSSDSWWFEEIPLDDEMSSDAACDEGLSDVKRTVAEQPELVKIQVSEFQITELSLHRFIALKAKLAEILRYVKFANPLITMINSLFQGLSVALISSFK